MAMTWDDYWMAFRDFAIRHMGPDYVLPEERAKAHADLGYRMGAEPDVRVSSWIYDERKRLARGEPCD